MVSFLSDLLVFSWPLLFLDTTFPNITAPSFVPRSHGVVSHMPKAVVASQVYGRRAVASRPNDIKMMPIGVPKVAYRVPGSQSADWYVGYGWVFVVWGLRRRRASLC